MAQLGIAAENMPCGGRGLKLSSSVLPICLLQCGCSYGVFIVSTICAEWARVPSGFKKSLVNNDTALKNLGRRLENADLNCMGKLLLLSSVSCTLVTPLATTKKKFILQMRCKFLCIKWKQFKSKKVLQFTTSLPCSCHFSRKMQRMLRPSSNFFSFSILFFSSFLAFMTGEIHQPNNRGNTTQMQLINFLLEFAESLKHQLCNAWSALFIPKQASSHLNCSTQQFHQLLHSPWHVRMVKEYSTMKIWIMVRSLTT